MITVVMLGNTFKITSIQWKYIEPMIKAKGIQYAVVDDKKD